MPFSGASFSHSFRCAAGSRSPSSYLMDGLHVCLLQKFQTDGKQYNIDVHAPTFAPLLRGLPRHSQ